MSPENRKRLRRSQQSIDGFIGAPAGQERKTISAFVDDRQSSSATQFAERQLDNFKRAEGYHSLSSRQVGLTPVSQPALAMVDEEDSASALDKLPPSSTRRERREHKEHKHATWRRTMKRVTVVLILIVLISASLWFGKGHIHL